MPWLGHKARGQKPRVLPLAKEEFIWLKDTGMPIVVVVCPGYVEGMWSVCGGYVEGGYVEVCGGYLEGISQF